MRRLSPAKKFIRSPLVVREISGRHGSIPAASLREAGHDAVDLRDQRLLKMEDSDILQKARTEQRFVLDFGDLLAASGEKLPSVIIFRLRNQTPSSVRPRLFEILSECETELNAG